MGFIPKSLPLSDLFGASRKTRKSQAVRLHGSPRPKGLKPSSSGLPFGKGKRERKLLAHRQNLKALQGKRLANLSQRIIQLFWEHLENLISFAKIGIMILAYSGFQALEDPTAESLLRD